MTNTQNTKERQTAIETIKAAIAEFDNQITTKEQEIKEIRNDKEKYQNEIRTMLGIEMKNGKGKGKGKGSKNIKWKELLGEYKTHKGKAEFKVADLVAWLVEKEIIIPPKAIGAIGARLMKNGFTSPRKEGVTKIYKAA
jgi:hypothetical protein